MLAAVVQMTSGSDLERNLTRAGELIDLAASRGAGVNGLTVGDVSVSDGTIQFGLSSPFKWNRSPVVVFRPATPNQR